MTPPRVLTAEDVDKIDRLIERCNPEGNYTFEFAADRMLVTIRDRDAKIAKLRAALEQARFIPNDEFDGPIHDFVKRVLEETA